VISDVEMPQVDGFHLTRRIKEHVQLKHLPVLLYSSILTPDNIKKADFVGADAQITKPELHRLVEVVDQLILKSKNNEVPSVGLRGTRLAAPHRPSRSEQADQLSTIGS
jgi:two-component system chemotaxis response regulator CheV